MNNLIKIDIFSKKQQQQKPIPIVNRYMKRCTSLIIMEIQINTMIYYLTPGRMATIKQEKKKKHGSRQGENTSM